MMAEIGLPMFLALFVEIDSLLLLLILLTYFTHEATAFWDVAYAEELARCYRHDHTLAAHHGTPPRQAS